MDQACQNQGLGSLIELDKHQVRRVLPSLAVCKAFEVFGKHTPVIHLVTRCLLSAAQASVHMCCFISTVVTQMTSAKQHDLEFDSSVIRLVKSQAICSARFAT